MKQVPSYEKVQHIQSSADTADRDNWVYAVVLPISGYFLVAIFLRWLMNRLIKKSKSF